MKRALFLFACLIMPWNLHAQEALGKNPNDRIMPGLFTNRWTNADAIIDGINRHASGGLKIDPRVLPAPSAPIGTITNSVTLTSTNGIFSATTNPVGVITWTYVETNTPAGIITGTLPLSTLPPILNTNSATFTSTNGYFTATTNSAGLITRTYVETNAPWGIVSGAPVIPSGTLGNSNSPAYLTYLQSLFQPIGAYLTSISALNAANLTGILPITVLPSIVNTNSATFNGTNGYFTATTNASGVITRTYVETNAPAGIVTGVMSFPQLPTSLVTNNELGLYLGGTWNGGTINSNYVVVSGDPGILGGYYVTTNYTGFVGDFEVTNAPGYYGMASSPLTPIYYRLTYTPFTNASHSLAFSSPMWVFTIGSTGHTVAKYSASLFGPYTSVNDANTIGVQYLASIPLLQDYLGGLNLFGSQIYNGVFSGSFQGDGSQVINLQASAMQPGSGLLDSSVIPLNVTTNGLAMTSTNGYYTPTTNANGLVTWNYVETNAPAGIISGSLPFSMLPPNLNTNSEVFTGTNGYFTETTNASGVITRTYVETNAPWSIVTGAPAIPSGTLGNSNAPAYLTYLQSLFQPIGAYLTSISALNAANLTGILPITVLPSIVNTNSEVFTGTNGYFTATTNSSGVITRTYVETNTPAGIVTGVLSSSTLPPIVNTNSITFTSTNGFYIPTTNGSGAITWTWVITNAPAGIVTGVLPIGALPSIVNTNSATFTGTNGYFTATTNASGVITRTYVETNAPAGIVTGVMSFPQLPTSLVTNNELGLYLGGTWNGGTINSNYVVVSGDPGILGGYYVTTNYTGFVGDFEVTNAPGYYGLASSPLSSIYYRLTYTPFTNASHSLAFSSPLWVFTIGSTGHTVAKYSASLFGPYTSVNDANTIGVQYLASIPLLQDYLGGLNLFGSQIYNGVFSGSFQGDGSGLLNVVALSLASGNQTINGNLTVTGSLSTDSGNIHSDGSGDLILAGQITATEGIYADSGNFTSDGSGNVSITGTFQTDGGQINSDGSGTLNVQYLNIANTLTSDNGAIRSDGQGMLNVNGTYIGPTGITNTSGPLALTQTGAPDGATELLITSIDGLNGAEFINPGDGIIDFGFQTYNTTTHANNHVHSFRMEQRNNSQILYTNDPANTTPGQGEFEIQDTANNARLAIFGQKGSAIGEPLMIKPNINAGGNDQAGATGMLDVFGDSYLRGNVSVSSGQINGNGAGITNVPGTSITSQVYSNYWGCTFTTNIFVTTVPSNGTNLWELSAYALVNSVTVGTVTFNFTYTDERGGSRTAQVGSVANVTGPDSIPVQPFVIKGGTTATLTATVTGTINFDCYGRLR